MTAERWVALLTALILLAGCWRVAVASMRRGDGLLTAETVFLAVWGMALGLFAIPWIRYTQSSLEAWVAIYGSIATFMLGCWAARRRLQAMPARPAGESLIGFNQRRLAITWLVLFVLGLTGFAAFVLAVDASLGWESLLTNPQATRSLQSASQTFKSDYGLWKLLTYFNQVAFLLWTIGLRARLFGGRWRIAYFVGAVSLVPYVFTGDRTLILTSLIWIALFHLLWRPPAQPKRFAMLIGISAIALITVFSLLGARVGKTIDAHPEISTRMTTQTLSVLALPYVYLTGNTPTFSQLIKDPIRPHTDGKLTFLPLVKVAHKLGIGATPPEQVGAFYPIPFDTFNNYGWLGNIYLDFGLIGCLVVPLLFGFLACWLVLLALRKGSLIAIWFGSLALFVVAYTPLINKLASTLVWQYMLLGPLIVLIVRDKPTPRETVTALRRKFAGLPKAVRISTVAASLILLLVLAALAATRSERQTTPPPLSATVAHAKLLALKTEESGVLPGAYALASRLHAADPAHIYRQMCLQGSEPATSGVIGVFTEGPVLRLATRDSSGRLLDSAPAPIDLANATTATVLRPVNRDYELLLTPDNVLGNAVANLSLPSSPKIGATAELEFHSRDLSLLRDAHPYVVLGYCTETVQPGRRRKALAIPISAGAARNGSRTYRATTKATKPGFALIGVFADSPESAARMRDSIVGGYRLTISPPAG